MNHSYVTLGLFALFLVMTVILIIPTPAVVTSIILPFGTSAARGVEVLQVSSVFFFIALILYVVRIFTVPSEKE